MSCIVSKFIEITKQNTSIQENKYKIFFMKIEYNNKLQ